MSFSKTSNCTRPSDSCNFDRLVEKLTRACFFQIALETILLPVHIECLTLYIIRVHGCMVNLWSSQFMGWSIFKAMFTCSYLSGLFWKIIINYWTRSRKISRFVGGKQINYLPMPKAEANNWSASHRQIVIFCEISSNNCFIIHLQSITLSLKLYFLKNYLITSSSLIFLACKYCRKTLTAVLVAFLYSLSFFL